MKRTLTLKREDLARLDAGEMASVVGGQYTLIATCPVRECVGPITLPPSCFTFPWC